MTSVSEIATEAEKVIETAMKFEPYIATAAGFVPQAAPIVAIVHPAVAMAAPFVEKALLALAAGNGGDVMGSFIELLQHMTPGKPNSPILSPFPIATSPAQDPSAQGSG